MGVEADLESAEQTQAMLSRVGSVDVLVLDALSTGTVHFSPSINDPSTLERASQLEHAQQCINLALPRMAERRAGRIFLLSPAAANDRGG